MSPNKVISSSVADKSITSYKEDIQNRYHVINPDYSLYVCMHHCRKIHGQCCPWFQNCGVYPRCGTRTIIVSLPEDKKAQSDDYRMQYGLVNLCHVLALSPSAPASSRDFLYLVS